MNTVSRWSWLALVLALGGCCTPIGPNHVLPPAPAPDMWNQPMGAGVVADCADDCAWWSTFEDPVLNQLVAQSVSANLSLREAGMRVVAARALRGVVAGDLFPAISADAAYARRQSSGNGNPFGISISPIPFDLYSTNLNVSWEIDLFGRLRRAVEAATAEVGVSVEDYNGVMVSLLADVASTYVDVRTFQNRLVYARQNLDTQEKTLKLTQDRFNAGDVGELDVAQARSNVMTTKAEIPLLEVGLQQAKNRLCVLRGEPPRNIDAELAGSERIPAPARDVAVCVPAELLRRRPDIRRAEREVAAQSARIGVALGDWYPQFSLIGTVGVAATDISRLFTANSLTYNYGPTAQWNILMFGRIRNNVAAQRALHRSLVIGYQNTVLVAVEEVEAGMVALVREKERAEALAAAVDSSRRAVELAEIQYRGGLVNFQTVLDTQRALLLLQDRLVTSHGAVARDVIAIYRALGGGWGLAQPTVPVPAHPVTEAIPPGTPEALDKPAGPAPPVGPQPPGGAKPANGPQSPPGAPAPGGAPPPGGAQPPAAKPADPPPALPEPLPPT